MEPWILRLLLVITVVTNVVYSCYQSSWCVEEDWLAPPGTLGSDSDCVKKSRVKSGQGFCVVQRDATNGHPVVSKFFSDMKKLKRHTYGVDDTIAAVDHEVDGGGFYDFRSSWLSSFSPPPPPHPTPPHLTKSSILWCNEHFLRLSMKINYVCHGLNSPQAHLCNNWTM